MADKSHADLLTELQVLREENERLKAELNGGYSPQKCKLTQDHCKHFHDGGTCCGCGQAAALSSSPAQEQKK